MTDLIAQAAAPTTTSSGPGGLTFVLEMLLMFGAIYFLMIAPQQKKKKQQDAMLAALKTGDEVITTGGIFGVITNVKDDRYVVRIAEGTKIEIGKAFIQGVVNKPDAEEKKSS